MKGRRGVVWRLLDVTVTPALAAGTWTFAVEAVLGTRPVPSPLRTGTKVAGAGFWVSRWFSSLPRMRGRDGEGAIATGSNGRERRIAKARLAHEPEDAGESTRAKARNDEGRENCLVGIRAHRLGGVSFRRQVPIGPYTVDFVSHSRKLIIEIDGAQHYDPDQMKRDARREMFLVAKGFRVLRFNNNDVIANREGVLSLIVEILQSAPSLPSPASAGGDPRERRIARYTAWSEESPP